MQARSGASITLCECSWSGWCQHFLIKNVCVSTFWSLSLSLSLSPLFFSLVISSFPPLPLTFISLSLSSLSLPLRCGHVKGKGNRMFSSPASQPGWSSMPELRREEPRDCNPGCQAENQPRRGLWPTQHAIPKMSRSTEIQRTANIDTGCVQEYWDSEKSKHRHKVCKSPHNTQPAPKNEPMSNPRQPTEWTDWEESEWGSECRKLIILQ